MSAATPRVAPGASDGRRIGIAVGALVLAVALLVGAAIVRQTGVLSAPSTDSQGVTVSVGGYTGIPYTPSRSLGAAVGGYTGIPYTPTRQLQSVGGYTGIPYTPTRVEAPEQLPGLHGGSGASGGGAASNRLRMAR